MRQPFLVISTLCALLAVTSPALATGNVLLPSSSGDNSAPNLGLAPPAPAASQTATPLQSTPQPAPAEVAQPPAYSSTSNSSSNAATTPTGSVDINSIVSPADEASAKNLPAGTLPTRIIHQNDDSKILAQANANLPYAMTISLGARSLFGSRDVEEIGNKLGLSRNQVGASCMLSLTGLMQSDKGGYIVNGGLSMPVTARYDGTITSYLLNAQALCTAGRLPPGSGFVTEIGNRYVVPLQAVSCAPPKRQASEMIVTYDGSGTSQCSYQ